MLAAARCNLFSYSLAAYQTNWAVINEKNKDVLETHIKVIEKEPRKHNFGILKELAQEVEEASKTVKEESEPAKSELSEDQRLFFGDEFSDNAPKDTREDENAVQEERRTSDKLIEYEKDFEEFMESSNLLLPSQLLMDDSLFNNSSTEPTNVDLLGSLLAEQDSNDLLAANKEGASQMNKNPSKKAADVSKWFNLFSELDPLNQQFEQDDASKNLHAA